MMRTRGSCEKFASRSSPVLSAEPSFTTMIRKSRKSESSTEAMVCTMTLSSLCAGIRTVTLGGGSGITAWSGRSFSITASTPMIAARPLQHNAENEDGPDKEAEPLVKGKDDSVDPRFQQL